MFIRLKTYQSQDIFGVHSFLMKKHLVQEFFVYSKTKTLIRIFKTIGKSNTNFQIKLKSIQMKNMFYDFRQPLIVYVKAVSAINF